MKRLVFSLSAFLLTACGTDIESQNPFDMLPSSKDIETFCSEHGYMNKNRCNEQCYEDFVCEEGELERVYFDVEDITIDDLNFEFTE